MKAWQEAASLMLAARHGRAVSPAVHNYELLCLKRHQKSSFMPGLYVFPGGTVDPADASLKWREHLAAFGLGDDRLASLVPKAASRPQIFRPPTDGELLREVSLRVTAIRETFEECGILICRRDVDDSPSGWAQHVSVPGGELRTWQERVHNNATEFLELCRRLECYPDLWALHEWRNWLTPTTVYEKRFDTAFYLTCMPRVPHAEYDAVEMEDLKWETPARFTTTGVTLPPPQQIEIAWLTRIKNIDDLLNVAVQRSREGAKLYMPVRVQLKDGVMHLLPGDTMYPRELSLLEKKDIDMSDITMGEFERRTAVKNRLEFLDTHVNVIFTGEDGKDERVEFSMPGYFKKAYGNTKE
ncbi:PREDICTED: nucleoside diphosphate-linked moiety X motif 19, mitochondrial [Vollenhovia emeryi]|uniref:nucleoside diphosphate-linked moiety X motif 19, mitochondrial n=1 Tax=Vollenhovia emeryi TaxID=411798 RepID=UPI0005F58E43|nr:PREDICTED: nucleoside diphosphate-linked moiety X motif 19, mitochondrial [Vollenhovia emeryi]